MKFPQRKEAAERAAYGRDSLLTDWAQQADLTFYSLIGFEESSLFTF